MPFRLQDSLEILKLIYPKAIAGNLTAPTAISGFMDYENAIKTSQGSKILLLKTATKSLGEIPYISGISFHELLIITVKFKEFAVYTMQDSHIVVGFHFNDYSKTNL